MSPFRSPTPFRSFHVSPPESQRHDAWRNGRHVLPWGSQVDCATRSLMQPKAPCATRRPPLRGPGRRAEGVHIRGGAIPKSNADSRLQPRFRFHSAAQLPWYFSLAATACRATNKPPYPHLKPFRDALLAPSCLPIPASAHGNHGLRVPPPLEIETIGSAAGKRVSIVRLPRETRERSGSGRTRACPCQMSAAPPYEARPFARLAPSVHMGPSFHRQGKTQEPSVS